MTMGPVSKQTLGQSVRAQRGERTQVAIAEAAGIAQATLSMIECDRATPSLGTLYRLADALGCTAGELLDEAAA